MMKPGNLIGRLRAWKRAVHDALDARRQAEMVRLMTRAGRRCYRDFRHLLSECPEGEEKEFFRQRADYWQAVFWDAQQYRDQMHIEIAMLEMRVERLKELLKENGIEVSGFEF